MHTTCNTPPPNFTAMMTRKDHEKMGEIIFYPLSSACNKPSA